MNKYKKMIKSDMKSFIVNDSNVKTIDFLKQSGVAFFPIEQSIEGIRDTVIKLFGKNYNSELLGYYFPPLFKYKYNKGTEVKVKQVNDGIIIDHIHDRLPELKYKPNNTPKTHNTLFDFSQILSRMIRPSTDKYWDTVKIGNSNVLVDILSRFVTGETTEQFNSVHKLELPFENIANYKYDATYISINLDELDRTILEKHLIPTVKLQQNELKQTRSMFKVLFRFIIRTYGQDFEPDEPYAKTSEGILRDNVIFIVIKGDNYFIIDLKECKFDLKLTTKTFLKTISKTLLKLFSVSKGRTKPVSKKIVKKSLKKMAMGKPMVSNATESDSRRERRSEEKALELLEGSAKTVVKNKIDKIDIELEDDELKNDVEEDIDFTDETLDNDDEINELKSMIRNTNTGSEMVMSPNQLRARNKLINEMGKIDVDGRTLDEIIEDKESTVIDNTPIPNVTVKDKSLLTPTVLDIERTYLQKTFNHDLFKIIKSFGDENKSAPLLLKSYKVKDTSDVLNDKLTYTFKFLDSKNKYQTTNVTIPKIDNDGYFILNGNKKNLKKQYHSIPIVKVSPEKVIFTSIQNKLFLERGGTTLNNESHILKRLIDNYLMDYKGNKCEIKIGYNIKLNSSVLTSLDYDELAKYFHKIILRSSNKSTGGKVFYFNQQELRDKIKKINPKYKFDTQRFPFGIDYDKNEVLTIDMSLDRTESIVRTICEAIDETGIIPNFWTEYNRINHPKRRMYTRLMVLGKEVPLITFIGYLYGLKTILDETKTKITLSPKKLHHEDRASFYSFGNISSC